MPAPYHLQNGADFDHKEADRNLERMRSLESLHRRNALELLRSTHAGEAEERADESEEIGNPEVGPSD